MTADCELATMSDASSKILSDSLGDSARLSLICRTSTFRQFYVIVKFTDSLFNLRACLSQFFLNVPFYSLESKGITGEVLRDIRARGVSEDGLSI